MATIAIFRQAKLSQISSFNHLINTHEITNQNPKNNHNINNDNKIIVFDAENDKFISRNFKRNGQNADGVKELHEIAETLDKQARLDYKAHKEKEKANNPTKKIRTVLQSKNLRKEFGVFLGGDKKIGSKAEFEENALKTALKVLETKGLDKKNLICLVIHYDEKTPHAHISYNDYSYLHKTTGSELCKIRDKNITTKAQYSINTNAFGEFQDIVAHEMGMERGQHNSKAQNRSKSQHFAILAEQSEQLKAENSALRTKNRDLTEKNNDIEIDREILPVLNTFKQIVKQSTPAELQIARDLWRPKNTENQFDFNNQLRRTIADFWDEQAIKKQKALNERKQKQLQHSHTKPQHQISR